MKSKIKFLFIALIIIIIDQFCKFNVISFEKTIGINKLFTVANYSNFEQAYSLGVDSIILLLAINILLIYFLLRILVKSFNDMSNANILGIILILAGEFSNLFDRIFRGYIVKFVKIFDSIPFNMAHVSIIGGIIIIIASTLIVMLKAQEN